MNIISNEFGKYDVFTNKFTFYDKLIKCNYVKGGKIDMSNHGMNYTYIDYLCPNEK